MALQFNLLPWREENRLKNKKSVYIFLISSLILSLILSAGYYFLKQSDLQDHRAALKRLKDEVVSLQPKLKKKKELIALREKLNRQIDSIESLQANRDPATHMVEELAKAVRNKDIYIDSFELKNGDVTATGYAKADTDISKLLISLQQSGWYLVPEVKTIKRAEDLGTETKSFEITSKLVLPGNQEGGK